MKERIKNIIPAYAVLPLLSCLAVNFLVYTGIAPLADDWKHYDLTMSFDRAVPTIPGFVVVYLGCYLFWVINYILIARQGKEHCYRFVTADIMSRLICCCFFWRSLPQMYGRCLAMASGRVYFSLCIR